MNGAVGVSVRRSSPSDVQLSVRLRQDFGVVPEPLVRQQDEIASIAPSPVGKLGPGLSEQPPEVSG